MITITDLHARPCTPARPGRAMTPQYITIHNTANTNRGAGAVSHAKYLRGAGAKNTVSYHFAVDDHAIVRIIPENEHAWHAGDGANGTGNRKSLAIEICENPESSLAAATENAAELTADLMRRYHIPLANVVQHNHWSGKNCPRRIRAGEPYGWDTFLAHVKAHYDGAAAPENRPVPPSDTLYTVQTGAFRSKENADAYAASLKAKGVDAFVSAKKG